MDKNEMMSNSKLIIQKVQKLIKYGNGNRLIVKDKAGKVILNLPITVCAGVGLWAPILFGAGFGMAYLAECEFSVCQQK